MKLLKQFSLVLFLSSFLLQFEIKFKKNKTILKVFLQNIITLLYQILNELLQ